MDKIDLNILKKCEGFRDVKSLEEVELVRLGGLSNVIFMVRNKETNFKVIYRIFCDYFRLFLNR
jgi:hypothetical protein